jgi:hypothetical protein
MTSVGGAVRRIVRQRGSVSRPLGIRSYHRVAEPVVDPWNLAVAPHSFAVQLAGFDAVRTG